MNENQEFNTTYRTIIGIAWLVMIALGIISLLVNLIFFKQYNWYMFPISYILGAMTNIFAFNLLKNNIANLTADAKSGISGSFSNYAIRLMIYAFVLFISFEYTEKLNPVFVFIGFLTVRIAIYIYTWLNRSR